MIAAQLTRRWLILAAPIGLALVWLVFVTLFEWLGPADATLCMFRNVTGWPCPTCGTTRAALAVIDGRPFDAVAHNPLVTLGATACIVWLVFSHGRRRPQRRVDRRWRAALWTIAGVLVVANWGYLIVRQGTSS